MKSSYSLILGLSLSLFLAGCGSDSASDSQVSTTTSVPTSTATAPSTTTAVRVLPEPSPAPAGTSGPGEVAPHIWIIPSASTDVPPPAEPNIVTSPPFNSVSLRTAYQFPGIPNKGQGEIIAIVDAFGSPTLAADVSQFCTSLGIAQCNLVQATVTGQNPDNSYSADIVNGWALETTLDVEWAHAISPQATILLVVSNNPSSTSIYPAIYQALHTKLDVTTDGTTVSTAVHQFSGSFGGAEFSTEVNFDSTYFGVANTTSFFSSGDTGGILEWPAASPLVTSVGGTSLSLDSTGTISSESAWSDGGGGQSVYESIPTYQSSIPQVSTVCGTQRGVPDVSYDSDSNTGVQVYCTSYPAASDGGHWYQVGGTSAAAPQWAAFMARVNRGRAVAGKNPINNFNTVLYGLYATMGASSLGLNDITQGHSSVTDGQGVTTVKNTAGAGYDLCAGLGTPKALTLYNNLVDIVP